MFNPNPVNDPTLPGQKAGEVETIGANGRYELFPVHTRFDAVAWFVLDREVVDDMGWFEIVVQADSRRAALDALERIRPGYANVADRERCLQDAREKSREYPNLKVYVYQYNSRRFGFRFGPAENSDPGLLIACCVNGESVSSPQAPSWEDYRESAVSGAIGADGYCYSDADPGM